MVLAAKEGRGLVGALLAQETPLFYRVSLFIHTTTNYDMMLLGGDPKSVTNDTCRNFPSELFPLISLKKIFVIFNTTGLM